MLSGKGIANPSSIAIPWTHSPVASKLGASPLMARAQRITLRLWLAFCDALHIDKSFQSASPCGLASWTFVVTQSRHDGEFHLME